MKISLKLNFLLELCPGAALILRHLAETEAGTWRSRRLSLSWNAKTSHVRIPGAVSRWQQGQRSTTRKLGEGRGIVVGWDGQGRLPGGGGSLAILQIARAKNRRGEKAEAGSNKEREGLV